MTATPDIDTQIESLMEQLADIEHQRWADWQSWVHTLYRDNREMFDTYIERWEKQIATPYSELSEREKQSDRDQVNRYLPAIKTLLIQSIDDALANQATPTASGKQVGKSSSGAYHDGYRDGYQTAKHEALQKFENENYQ